MTSSDLKWHLDVPVEENPYYWNEDPVVFGGSGPDVSSPTVVELFSGLGGFSQGFIQAGFGLALGADIHRPSVDSFRHNHPESTTILGDLRKVSGAALKGALDGVSPDVMLAGVPCQGFSLNNRKRHDGDERNTLFREFMRLAKKIKPRAVVIENVSGIRGAGGGDFVKAITAEIENTLNMQPHVLMLNAADFGVPQLRHRVFFVGIPRDATWLAPQATHGPKAKVPYLTVRDAIQDLPPLGSGESTDKYRRRTLGNYAQLMKGSQRLLLNHQAPTHPQSTIDRILRTEPGEPLYSSFRQRIRLHWDKPSPTQVSGGIRSQFQFAHPEQPRGLTIRERCRIQSFPDSTWVSGGLVQGRVQTGNAVPPTLAEAIALALRDSLGI